MVMVATAHASRICSASSAFGEAVVRSEILTPPVLFYRCCIHGFMHSSCMSSKHMICIPYDQRQSRANPG